jgi:hypothetical protein
MFLQFVPKLNNNLLGIGYFITYVDVANQKFEK